MINTKAMLSYDRIFICGEDARADLRKSCEKRGIESHYSFLKPENVEAYLEVCGEVWARWHTTNKFKVGDKVYVKSNESYFRECIRAHITEITARGYHLKAFTQDLPGIYMFNIWDKDLIRRKTKKKKFLPYGE